MTCIAWSSSGQSLAFSSHSSRIYVVDCSNSFYEHDPPPPVVISRDTLPLSSLIFKGESLLIAAGYGGTVFSIDVSSSEKRDKSYNELVPGNALNTAQRNSRNVSCLQTFHGSGQPYVSASGPHGLFLIIKI